MSELLPKPIDLTPGEKQLLATIRFDLHGDASEAEASCSAAADLMRSLSDRCAVPEARLRYFLDPDLNIGLKKSRREVFEANGTTGDAILEHPHFLPNLRYFLFGPNLPPQVVAGFVRIVREDLGSSGQVRQQLRAFARASVRSLSEPRADAAEEFFKLSIEAGLDDDSARSVRDAALSAR